MDGYTEFYPFCYLLIAAGNAIESAKLRERGCNHHYATAVLFSAFAVEAAVNHVGSDHVPDWEKNERKMGGWKAKLDQLAARFGLVFDYQTRPAVSVKEAFEIRRNLAHGKTWVGEQCYLDKDDGSRDASLPDWLLPIFNEAKATQVLIDAQDVIGQLLAKAGYPIIDLLKMGQGSYQEVLPPAQPRKAVWKIKGT
jgi:hypothetical protein